MNSKLQAAAAATTSSSISTDSYPSDENEGGYSRPRPPTPNVHQNKGGRISLSRPDKAFDLPNWDLPDNLSHKDNTTIGQGQLQENTSRLS